VENEREVRRYLPDYCPSPHGGRNVRCCVFAFFAVPPPQNRHVRRKERTTKEVAGKPVSPSPGGTPGSGRGPSRCPSFKNSQAKIQSGVPCPASNGLSIVRSEIRDSGPEFSNRDLGAHHSASSLFGSFFLTRIFGDTDVKMCFCNNAA